MFEKLFNRPYDFHEFSYFVSRKENKQNKEYAKMMHEEKWIPKIWNRKVNCPDELRENDGEEAKRIAQHGGLILDVCSGPSGGYMPAVLLLENYEASIMVNDLCPTVVREWRNLHQSLTNPPQHVEYAAFDVCDIPFNDNCIDVVSGYSAIINIEGGNYKKALSEIYKVLKKGGLFVMGDQVVTKEYYDTLTLYQQTEFMKRCPNVFTDFHDELQGLGFTSIETVIKGTWSNKNDDSNLANFTRNLGAELVFTTYTKYCIK